MLKRDGQFGCFQSQSQPCNNTQSQLSIGIISAGSFTILNDLPENHQASFQVQNSIHQTTTTTDQVSAASLSETATTTQKTNEKTTRTKRKYRTRERKQPQKKINKLLNENSTAENGRTVMKKRKLDHPALSTQSNVAHQKSDDANTSVIVINGTTTKSQETTKSDNRLDQIHRMMESLRDQNSQHLVKLEDIPGFYFLNTIHSFLKTVKSRI